MRQFKRLPRKKKKEFLKMGFDLALVNRVRSNPNSKFYFISFPLDIKQLNLIPEEEIIAKRIKGYEPIF